VELVPFPVRVNSSPDEFTDEFEFGRIRAQTSSGAQRKLAGLKGPASESEYGEF
jgi:hypothetical protein